MQEIMQNIYLVLEIFRVKWPKIAKNGQKIALFWLIFWIMQSIIWENFIIVHNANA